MITSLIIGQDKLIGDWVKEQLKIDSFDPYTAIGVVADGKIIGGVVYNNFHTDAQGNPLFIEMTIASIDKRFAPRHNITTFFAYPFIQLNVKRVQMTCSADSRQIRALLIRLGFQFEGIGRSAFHLGGDSAVYSMLKHECGWIKHVI